MPQHPAGQAHWVSRELRRTLQRAKKPWRSALQPGPSIVLAARLSAQANVAYSGAWGGNNKDKSLPAVYFAPRRHSAGRISPETNQFQNKSTRVLSLCDC